MDLSLSADLNRRSDSQSPSSVACIILLMQRSQVETPMTLGDLV